MGDVENLQGDGIEGVFTSGTVGERNGEEVGFRRISFQVKTIDSIVDDVVKVVRDHGIRYGHVFFVRKVLFDGEESSVSTGQIFPSGGIRWDCDRVSLELKSSNKLSTAYPKRLHYLQEIAQRCDLVGGRDEGAILPKESDYQQFAKNLDPVDRDSLVKTYQEIVNRKDNEWFVDWLREGEWSEWAGQFSWLLSLLDRLREYGFMDDTPGIAKDTVLHYWDHEFLGERTTVRRRKKK